ncbi:MAG: hypothetical protein WAO12_08980 [Venatoribacter sp.]
MTGHYLKNKESSRLFYNWINKSIDKLSEAYFIECHTDEFSSLKLSKADLIKLSVDSYLELVTYSTENKIIDDVMPILVIPLVASDIIKSYENNLSDCSQLDIEPPSIYLLNRETSKYVEVMEEYKEPITIALPNISGCGFYSYYRCYRNDEYIKKDWEFNRAIYVECYPEKYMF